MNFELRKTLSTLENAASEIGFPPLTTGMTTRQVAEKQGISIYKARGLLLKLKERNQVFSSKSVSKRLTWFPIINRTV